MSRFDAGPRAAGWCGALLVLCLLGAASSVTAQTITDERVWFNLTLQSRSDAATPWRWSVEAILRSRDGVSTLDTAALRPLLSYNVTPHSSAGGGYVYVEYSPASIGLVEHRVFEQYVWTRGAGGGTLTIRERLEERFVDGNSGVAARLRQAVRFSRPIKRGSRISVVGNDEFLLHLNTTTLTQRGMDQNRAFVGISDTLNRSTRFEAGYLNQFVHGHVVPDRMNHVLSGALILSF